MRCVGHYVHDNVFDDMLRIYPLFVAATGDR